MFEAKNLQRWKARVVIDLVIRMKEKVLKLDEDDDDLEV
jgi:hypothetical protein